MINPTTRKTSDRPEDDWFPFYHLSLIIEKHLDLVIVILTPLYSVVNLLSVLQSLQMWTKGWHQQTAWMQANGTHARTFSYCYSQIVFLLFCEVCSYEFYKLDWQTLFTKQTNVVNCHSSCTTHRSTVISLTFPNPCRPLENFHDSLLICIACTVQDHHLWSEFLVPIMIQMMYDLIILSKC